ncbi:hypothetical protein EV360DRAFT_85069 [Lentinula raphanica]|nr:hypothetical protein EV360DRAFT_85069 [Lentinula raphanica]
MLKSLNAKLFIGFSLLLASSRSISALPLIAGEADDTSRRVPVLSHDVPLPTLGGIRPDQLRTEGLGLPLEENLIRRREVSVCKNLTEVKILPGFSKIEEYAKKHWGDGGHKFVAFDDKEPEFSALWCPPRNDPINITYEGEPDCQMSNVTTSGVLKDTTGTNTLLITQGTSITSLWMTSTSVNKDFSVGLTPMINYPSVTGITDSFSANSLVGTSDTDSKMEVLTDTQTVTVVMSSPAGNICQVNVQVRTCILQGKGEIPMVAKGWVWAEYDDKVKDHYKCKYSSLLLSVVFIFTLFVQGA